MYKPNDLSKDAEKALRLIAKCARKSHAFWIDVYEHGTRNNIAGAPCRADTFIRAIDGAHGAVDIYIRWFDGERKLLCIDLDA